jgi:hypothetical protein
MALQPQVIGCGARNTPCMGGTQIPIANPMPPIDISNTNIAPITAHINNTHNGFENNIIQIGVLYKIFGNYNTYLPLYYNNDLNEYYVYYKNKKVIVKSEVNGEMIGINDEIKIDNINYRATIFSDDIMG